MMYGLCNGYDGWGVGSPIGWIGGGIMMIVMMAAMIVFIMWVVRAMNGTHPHHGGSQAMAILKERYAKGEITKKQFEEMKEDIR